MGKAKKKGRSSACNRGFCLEDSGFEGGLAKSDLGLGESSCSSSSSANRSGCSDLGKYGVKRGVLPPIWLKIVDWQHPDSKELKIAVEKAAAKGQIALDLLLLRTADRNGLDIEELE